MSAGRQGRRLTHMPSFLQTALVCLDLAVVLAEVALGGVHPTHLDACEPPPPAAEAAAEGLHWATVSLLAVLNVDWVVRALIIGPARFFASLTHWLDAGLVAAALALELALHGAPAVAANLAVVLLRLARVGHAFVELSLSEAAVGGRRAREEAAAERARSAARLWRLAARAAAAQAAPPRVAG